MAYKWCPFCGGAGRKLTLMRDGSVHKPGNYIARFGCFNCSASVVGEGATPSAAWKAAIKNWNRRTK